MKSVTQNITGFAERLLRVARRTKGAWEPHVALAAEVENHWCKW